MHDTLVLSGGGPSAVAFIGCVRYLEHLGQLPRPSGPHLGQLPRPSGPHLDRMRTLVGTSAGAIFALLLALGHDSDSMESFLRKNAGELKLELEVDRLLELPERLGLYDTARVDSLLAREIVDKLGLGSEDEARALTFEELARKTGRLLYVCASDVGDACPVLFGVPSSRRDVGSGADASSREPRIRLVDDAPVLVAVRASYAVPLVFEPVRHGGRLYVDGALYANSPVACLGLVPCTSALCLEVIFNRAGAGRDNAGAETTEGCRHEGWTLQDYVLELMRGVVDRANASFIPRSAGAGVPRLLRVEMHAPPLAPWDFDVSALEPLVRLGYRSMDEAMPKPAGTDSVGDADPSGKGEDGAGHNDARACVA
jgi:predicted acylesterase/phospholipase RssA